MVVVPQYGDHRDPCDRGKNIGAGLGIARSPHAIRFAEGMGNKISGQNQQIRMKRLHQLYGPSQKIFAHVRTEMHVADLCNAKAMKVVG